MKNINLEFTHEDMQILQSALVELPFRIAAPLIDKINKQIQKNFDVNLDDKDKNQ